MQIRWKQAGFLSKYSETVQDHEAFLVAFYNLPQVYVKTWLLCFQIFNLFFFFLIVVRQRREADAALFSELYRKLGSQVV